MDIESQLWGWFCFALCDGIVWGRRFVWKNYDEGASQRKTSYN